MLFGNFVDQFLAICHSFKFRQPDTIVFVEARCRHFKLEPVNVSCCSKSRKHLCLLLSPSLNLLSNQIACTIDLILSVLEALLCV